METTTTVEVTRVSSKGQIVLPKDVRAKLHLKKGTLFAMQATKNIILLKKIDNPILKADLETLQKVEEAWDDIAHGRFHKASKEDFLKELATW